VPGIIAEPNPLSADMDRWSLGCFGGRISVGRRPASFAAEQQRRVGFLEKVPLVNKSKATFV
jgi:hypothetical protein